MRLQHKYVVDTHTHIAAVFYRPLPFQLDKGRVGRRLG